MTITKTKTRLLFLTLMLTVLCTVSVAGKAKAAERYASCLLYSAQDDFPSSVYSYEFGKN